jgi:hypothetical protein
MTGKSLKELLFEPWSPESESLFTTQIQLAKAIGEQPGSKYEGRVPSLATFLNQILNHDRPCPPDLQKELIAAAVRAAERQVAIGISGAPKTMEVEAVLKGKLSNPNGGGVELVTELLLRQVRAREVVIVNPSPLESRGHPRADEFLEATIEGALKSETRYIFLLDEQLPNSVEWQHEQIRRGLQESLERNDKRADRTAIEAEWQKLSDDSGGAPQIAIRTIPSSLCLIPVVAFDPSIPREMEAYVWDWDEIADRKVIDRVAKLSSVTARKWCRDFYLKYVSQPVSAN